MEAKPCPRPAAAPSAASRRLPGRLRRPGDFEEVLDVAEATPGGVRSSLVHSMAAHRRPGGTRACCDAERSSIPEARATSVEDWRVRGVQRPRRGAAQAPGRATEATPRPQQAYGPSLVICHGGGAP